MIVYPEHNGSKLVTSVTSQLECLCPNSKTTLALQCYVFDSGPFTLQGDGYISLFWFQTVVLTKEQWIPELGFCRKFVRSASSVGIPLLSIPFLVIIK
jgi:hypothetical protein